jgi:hypothetical protein
LGGRIFNGEAAGGTCLGCHGSDAKGSPQAPVLVTGKWLDSDGSSSGITRTITDGVPKPKHYSVPMPARGGAPLSDPMLRPSPLMSGRSVIRMASEAGRGGRYDFLAGADRRWIRWRRATFMHRMSTCFGASD